MLTIPINSFLQPRRCLDVERARKSFGFEAQTDFREGLKKTIDWYRQHAE